MTKITLSPIGSTYVSAPKLNANFEAISQAFERVVFRDASSPSFLLDDIDFNDFQILNLGDPVLPHNASTKLYVDDLFDYLFDLLQATDLSLSLDIAQLREDMEAGDATLAASISFNASVAADANAATAQTVLDLQAVVDSNQSFALAEILNEATVRATADTAMSSTVSALTSTVASNHSTALAAVTSEASTRATADTAIAATVTSLSSTVSNNYSTLNSAITTEASARTTADTANATSITNLTATVATKNQTFYQTSAPTAISVGDIWFDTDDSNKMYRWSGSAWVQTDNTAIAANTAAINTEASARASADAAIASTVTSLSSTVGTHTSQISNLAETYATNSGSSARLIWTVNTGTNAATISQTSHSGYSDGTWNGSAISLDASMISLNANAINFGSATTYENTKNTFYTIGGSYRFRTNGPFGTSSDLLMWYGLNSVSLNSETKTNGVFALATDGKLYYGGAELGTRISMSFSPSSINYSAAGSGGHTDSVTVTPSGGNGSYTYQWYTVVNGYTGTSKATLSSATSATCSLQGTFSSGGDVAGRLFCIVTDGLGVQATSSIPFSYSSTS